ncbi:MAG: biotin--[Clostridia bacterium]|nr:biotin--[acetyl-CoA-carboxylase] ligase [Clostridia bacterium]
MKAKIWTFNTLPSTNDEAKRRASEGAPSGTVILAEEQTGGRGRLGRTFYSPKGTGIYLSMILRLNLPPEESVRVTTAASVAVSTAIETVTGISPQIKWVNDLYFGGKKICGILAEMVGDAVILGVGINCSTVFSGELSRIAGSLFSQDEEELRMQLIAETILRLERMEETLLSPVWIEEYRKRSMVLGREVTLLQEPQSRYVAEDIGEKGELILRDAAGNLRVLASGEISIRLAE